MKLLLTSTGLTNQKIRDFFVSQFDRLDNKTAAVITSAQNAEEEFYIADTLRELSDLGVKVSEINIAKIDSFSDLSKFDIYYVCGGNTFYILDRMRKTGIDKVLKEAIRRDKFYVGVSAGSIIPGSDIEIARCGKDGDLNTIDLQNTKGLNVIPYLVFPHYTNAHKKEIEAFRRKRKGNVVITLTDAEALFVKDLPVGEDIFAEKI